MKSGIFSSLLFLVVAALSSSNNLNVAEAKESVAILRHLRALGYGSGGSSWGGDNGRDHPAAATQAPAATVRK
jgi:hypothetical protein